MILSAFLLGLLGAFSHCAGMCSGVALLLGRKAGATGPGVLLLHAGRLTTYTLLGLVAGAAAQAAGHAAGAVQSHLHAGAAHAVLSAGGSAGAEPPATLPADWQSTWQVALAIAAGGLAIYMAIAMLGRAPSPERLLAAVTRWWGRTMRAAPAAPVAPAGRGARGASARRAYLLGMLWGLLPCGLVLSALVISAAGASPLRGASAMLAFGLGTGPLGVAAGLAGRAFGRLPRLQPLSALLMLATGAQLALRGLSAAGWVQHLHLAGLMLW